MKIASDLALFQTRLGYRFKQPSGLIEAVTHASKGTSTRRDYQRLEFLGDRVLGLVIAQALLAQDQEASEGILALRYNALVRKETCAKIARDIDLGAVLKLGRSEMITGGRRKQTLLGDAMEAVIAAVYLDGGMEAAQALVLRLWHRSLQTVDGQDTRDAKTALQEWAQARGLPPPTYLTKRREGPDHAPVFEIEAQLSDGPSARAKAGTKRAAEQAAAQALLNTMEADT
ncbi:MAG: ribonuclease III [Paracoccaceae bacterium]